MPTVTRLNIYFTDEDDLALYELITAEAKTEKRSMSQMVKILASEAIAARHTKTNKSKKQDED
jgi:succinate dehydrogenase flavin-adding protein (antitoxin of CptAB toxin-antitoxin module)